MRVNSVLSVPSDWPMIHCDRTCNIVEADTHNLRHLLGHVINVRLVGLNHLLQKSTSVHVSILPV